MTSVDAPENREALVGYEQAWVSIVLFRTPKKDATLSSQFRTFNQELARSRDAWLSVGV